MNQRIIYVFHHKARVSTNEKRRKNYHFLLRWLLFVNLKSWPLLILWPQHRNVISLTTKPSKQKLGHLYILPHVERMVLFQNWLKGKQFFSWLIFAQLTIDGAQKRDQQKQWANRLYMVALDSIRTHNRITLDFIEMGAINCKHHDSLMIQLFASLFLFDKWKKAWKTVWSNEFW